LLLSLWIFRLIGRARQSEAEAEADKCRSGDAVEPFAAGGFFV